MTPRKRRPSARQRLQTATDVTRSGARRYPRHFLTTLRGGNGDVREVFRIAARRAKDSTFSAVWLGHATILMRIGERWILTDPVFSRRIGIKLGPVTVGMVRQLPAVDPATLPPIDLVLISHAHFDHLDRPTLRRLASPTTKVLTAARTSDLIPGGFEKVAELGWGEHIDLGEIVIRALRPEHWGARAIWDRHRGYNSYLIETPHKRVLFAGDTAYCDAFDRVAGVDLAVFGIGAYDPWIAKHANPEQVWTMATAAGAQHLLPMHHSTFELSDEPREEPMLRLRAAAGKDARRIVACDLGTLWTP